MWNRVVKSILHRDLFRAQEFWEQTFLKTVKINLRIHLRIQTRFEFPLKISGYWPLYKS